jgi:hypothetical protein
MTKKTGVTSEKIMDLVSRSGLKTKEQSGFLQVMGTEAGKIYVARTKTVSRIDISGFVVPDAVLLGMAVKNLGGENIGNVRQQVDFSFPEDRVLATVIHLLNLLKTLKPSEQEQGQARPKRMSKVRPAEEEDTSPPAREPLSALSELRATRTETGVQKTPEQVRAERLALIKKVAAEKGVPVHPSVAGPESDDPSVVRAIYAAGQAGIEIVEEAAPVGTGWPAMSEEEEEVVRDWSATDSDGLTD